MLGLSLGTNILYITTMKQRIKERLQKLYSQLKERFAKYVVIYNDAKYLISSDGFVLEEYNLSEKDANIIIRVNF